MEILKVSMLGIVCVLLGFVLHQTKPEFSVYMTLGVGICIMGLALEKMSYLMDTIGKIRDILPMSDSSVTALLKMIGITYVGQFSASLCEDAGYSAISRQISLFCKITLMALSMPVFIALLDTIEEFMT